MKKLFTRMLLLATLSVVFFSCSKDKGIVGTWECVDNPARIVIINEDHSIISGYYVGEDNKLLYKSFGTYTYKDNILTITEKGYTERAHISFEGNTMTVTLLDDDEEPVKLKRRKPVKMP